MCEPLFTWTYKAWPGTVPISRIFMTNDSKGTFCPWSCVKSRKYWKVSHGISNCSSDAMLLVCSGSQKTDILVNWSLRFTDAPGHRRFAYGLLKLKQQKIFFRVCCAWGCISAKKERCLVWLIMFLFTSCGWLEQLASLTRGRQSQRGILSLN